MSSQHYAGVLYPTSIEISTGIGDNETTQEQRTHSAGGAHGEYPELSNTGKLGESTLGTDHPYLLPSSL